MLGTGRPLTASFFTRVYNIIRGVGRYCEGEEGRRFEDYLLSAGRRLRLRCASGRTLATLLKRARAVARSPL